MLQTVDVGERSLEAYRGVAPDAILDELTHLAAGLRGVRVLHLNATPYGGGVSELLRSAVPIYNDLGLLSDWKIIKGDEAFFQVTKAIHNGLQGASLTLSEEQRAIYLANAKQNARMLEEEYDIVVVNDPQPAAILSLLEKKAARWIWRCHIDTSRPNPDVWGFFRRYLTGYDGAVFTMAEFVPPDFPLARVDIIPPAIDPLSPKNLRLPEETARQVLDWIGVRLNRPLITQVARFDPWKDPMGVVEAYKQARGEVPGIQLALVGSMALDDPEGWEVYRQLESVAEADPLIHVFTNLTGVGNIEVNAFQRLSSVVVQKSIREGFGLVVSEALWKGTPVVAGHAGGIPLQMADGVGGMLVDSVERCAAAMVHLLQHPAEAEELAARGRARVREHFLLPRLLLNELALMRDVLQSGPIRPMPASTTSRDPVCGMAVEAEPPLAATYQGRLYVFCSEACRTRFLRNPERYASH
jgi:trehalose synthase